MTGEVPQRQYGGCRGQQTCRRRRQRTLGGREKGVGALRGHILLNISGEEVLLEDWISIWSARGPNAFWEGWTLVRETVLTTGRETYVSIVVWLEAG